MFSSKGRGGPGLRPNQASSISGGPSVVTGDSADHQQQQHLTPAARAAKARSEQSADDGESESFCEMSLHRWNRGFAVGMPLGGPGGAGGLARRGLAMPEQQQPRHTAGISGNSNSEATSQQQQQRNEAMGIMWNNIGISKAKEMDDLYDEFDL